MTYPIVSYSPPNVQQWGDIPQLEVGQGFLVPWTDLAHYKKDGVLRAVAHRYSQKLGRKFGTRKDRDGVWLFRKPD
jgi:hypothetical protein